MPPHNFGMCGFAVSDEAGSERQSAGCAVLRRGVACVACFALREFAQTTRARPICPCCDYCECCVRRGGAVEGVADQFPDAASKRRALLKVTGRDVLEGECAVTMEAAVTLRATANLRDRSAEIVRFVNKHPEGVRAAKVAKEIDLSDHEARTYLGRLYGDMPIHPKTHWFALCGTSSPAS
jgi:hypothetical protein